MLRHRMLLTAAAALTAASVGLNGCDNPGGGGAAAQERDYVIPMDEPGAPIDNVERFIAVHNRIPGMLRTGQASKLNITPDVPRLIISGQQIFPNFQEWERSPRLRIEGVQEPPGARLVQVNVSLTIDEEPGPFPLRAVPSAERNQFVPAPVLHDSIDNAYWPIGYFLKDHDAPYLEINIDYSRQFKDLNRLPSLSRSKRQELILLYQVDESVELTGISYGGYDKRTFRLSTTDAHRRW